MRTIKDGEEFTLSHSSANTLRSCETRYYHYKIAKTPNDPDYVEEQESLMIGKAVHLSLEQTLHSYDKESFYHWTNYACSQFGLTEMIIPIQAMVFKLMKLQRGEGLYAVACEHEIKTEFVGGFIDLIARNEEGDWWIIDVKTAARLQPLTIAKLANDYQLNLYAAHADMIARDLGLDSKRFKGCRYRVVTKSGAAARPNETLMSYIKRTDSTIRAHEFIIDIEQMNPEAILKEHRELYRRARKLFEGAKPSKDYANCSSFFRPCPYWSKCHDGTYTECSSKFESRDY